MTTTTRIPRDVSVATAAASKDAVIRLLYFVELEFDGPSYLRFNASNVDIPWNGNIFYGAGNMGSISAIKEGSDLESNGLTLVLSGIKQEYISIALADDIQGRPVRVYAALLDENYHIIRDPMPLGPWRMDTMSIGYGDTCTLTLQCESRMAGWARSNVKRYTHEEQIARFPGDMGLEYIADMPTRDFNWGEEGSDIPNGLWFDRR